MSETELAEAFDRAWNPKAQLWHPEIYNGYYTLTFPCGTQKTFRLSTKIHGGLKGRRVLGLLIGPVNTRDYEDFAFLEPGGFKVWKGFVHKRQAHYAKLLWDLIHAPVEGHELLIAKHCLRCNLVLTDEESIKTGLGPTCRRKK